MYSIKKCWQIMQKTLNDDDKKFLKRAAVVSPEGSFLLVRERERA